MQRRHIVTTLFFSIIGRSTPRETEVRRAGHLHILRCAHVRCKVLDAGRDETRAFGEQLDQSITFRPETKEAGWNFAPPDCAGRGRHAAVLETHLEELTLENLVPFRDASTLGFRVCELANLALGSVDISFATTAAFLEEEREFGGDAIGSYSPGRWGARRCGFAS